MLVLVGYVVKHTLRHIGKASNVSYLGKLGKS